MDDRSRHHGWERARRAGVGSVGAVVLLLAGCTGGGTSPAASTSSSSSSSPAPAGGTGAAGAAADEQQALEQVIARTLPSVVEIRNSSGLGSGVVYDSKGDIVTNAHVVGSDTSFQVLTSGSATPVSARLVGTYPQGDLAVIAVSRPSGLRPATFADSSTARVGAIVLAMGNPLGLSATVTNGIISATGRTVSEPAENGSPGATLADMIQTSAPINPGNSGGALVTLDSTVIGLPTLAAVSSQEGGAAPGIGFAIPSNQVRRIADQLIRSGKVTNSGRAALGVQVTTVVDQSGQPQGAGVVAVTAGGPADKAGIRPGDVIVSVAGQQTPTVQALAAVLAGLSPGQSVPVVVQRGGKQQKVTVVLGEL
jgi:S1-C subfamily serine protease